MSNDVKKCFQDVGSMIFTDKNIQVSHFSAFFFGAAIITNNFSMILSTCKYIYIYNAIYLSSLTLVEDLAIFSSV